MVVLMRTNVLLAAALIVAVSGGVARTAGRGAVSLPNQVVEVSAERFAFTPSEIRTKVGTRLEIRVKSDDTTHGFRIVGTDINMAVPKRGRGVATIVFTPAEPGRYTFECSHTCGAGHSFMRGQIVVSK